MKKNVFKQLCLILFLLCVAGAALAQVGDALVGTAAESKQQGQSDEALFRSTIQALAADEYGGRKPLSEHEGPVLRFIEEKFREVGLQPANGISFLQKVPLLSVRSKIKNNRIDLKGHRGATSLDYWDEAVVWSLRSEEKLRVNDADLVFVGFGINAPEYGWNDYKGVDVKGKIVVILVNDPGFYDNTLFRGKNMTYYGRWTYKFEEAGRQGAAAAIIIHATEPASYDWSVVQNSRSGASLTLYSEADNAQRVLLQGWITGDAAAKIFNAAGLPLESSLAAAKKKGFRSMPLGLKSTIDITNDVVIAESANVAGVLPGTTQKDEYIIYSAHWDHLGVGAPINNDSIYNGADDNASGVAALILLARRFQQLPERPRRSILFLSVTAEESGLLGSEYYAAHPLFPLQKTVVNLNMDGYGNKARTHDIILAAAGDSETDRYVQDAAAAQGRIVKPAVNQTSGGYFRSDHFNFAKVGVPVVLAKGGRDYLDPQAVEQLRAKQGNRSTYHQPTDEYHAWWDVSGSLEDIYLLYSIGLRLSNDSYFPRWNDGSAYKHIRECPTK